MSSCCINGWFDQLDKREQVVGIKLNPPGEQGSAIWKTDKETSLQLGPLA